MRNIIFLVVLYFAAAVYAQTDAPLGVCAHLQGGSEYRQMPQNLELMYNAGFRLVRTDFSWSRIEPEKGTWKFDTHDDIVKQTQQNGLQILGLLIDHGVDWAAPAHQHLDDWLEYVEKTVRRYKDSIRYWEVWNEPNIERFWRYPSGKDYATLLSATYKKIKEIDPGITVLSAGTALLPMKFIEEMLQEQASNSFDVFCIHPYRAGFRSMTLSSRFGNDIKQLQTLLTKYNGGKPKRIWITEMGFPTPPLTSGISRNVSGLLKQAGIDGREIKTAALPASVQAAAGAANILNTFMVHDVFASEEEQAVYAPQAILLSLRFGIEKFIWYELQAPEDDNIDPEEHFGLTHRDLKPKPAYHSVTALGKFIADGVAIDTKTDWQQHGCCVVHWTHKDGTPVWAVWSPDGEKNIAVKIGSGLKGVFDVFGKPVPVNLPEQSLPVSPKILYLVGAETLSILH
ncbi:MAG: beta-galactosidase [Planctomycetaceae bacterium]|jgi:hypothetical protein|nr:beta-galactosidase [Planctomycetaceae bacterium]